ncbi:hypothetical protein J6590_085032 [Homalodisca vitripennis]|nr:hypothetical protein J6590_085032 [Homalodisca vitripennis]
MLLVHTESSLLHGLFSTLIRARPVKLRICNPKYRLDIVLHTVPGILSVEHSSNDVLGSDCDADLSRGKNAAHAVVRTEQTGRAGDFALELVGPKIPVAREKLGHEVIDLNVLPFHPWSNVRDDGQNCSRALLRQQYLCLPRSSRGRSLVCPSQNGRWKRHQRLPSQLIRKPNLGRPFRFSTLDWGELLRTKGQIDLMTSTSGFVGGALHLLSEEKLAVNHHPEVLGSRENAVGILLFARSTISDLLIARDRTCNCIQSLTLAITRPSLRVVCTTFSQRNHQYLRTFELVSLVETETLCRTNKPNGSLLFPRRITSLIFLSLSIEG